MWSARACLARSFKERRFPSWSASPSPKKYLVYLTSNVGDAENADGASLDDPALVGQQRRCTGGDTARTVLEVALVVRRTGLRRKQTVSDLSLKPPEIIKHVHDVDPTE